MLVYFVNKARTRNVINSDRSASAVIPGYNDTVSEIRRSSDPVRWVIKHLWHFMSDFSVSKWAVGFLFFTVSYLIFVTLTTQWVPFEGRQLPYEKNNNNNKLVAKNHAHCTVLQWGCFTDVNFIKSSNFIPSLTFLFWVPKLISRFSLGH